MSLRPEDFNPERARMAPASAGKPNKFDMPERVRAEDSGFLTRGCRLLLAAYLVAVIGACLFPPWVVEMDNPRMKYSSPAEYRFIGDPPRTTRYESAAVDVARFFLTLCTLTAAAGVVALWVVKPLRPTKNN